MKTHIILKNVIASALLLLATHTIASTPATVAYVNAADDKIKTSIESKGGSVGQLDCQNNNPPPASNATVAYVDACDDELNAAINSIPVGSKYTVGDALCGMDNHVCGPLEAPWGIVIYVDPNPTVNGHNGIAMSVEDVVVGYSGGPVIGIRWGSNLPNCGGPNTTDPNCADVGANDYSIYGGITNTEAIQDYCDANPSYCVTFNNSAFSSCIDYGIPGALSGWYLPSIAEMTLMFTYAQTQALPPNPDVEQFKSYYYWSSTQWNGSAPADSLGNISYSPNTGSPAQIALVFDFIDGSQNLTNKDSDIIGARCARAF